MTNRAKTYVQKASKIINFQVLNRSAFVFVLLRKVFLNGENNQNLIGMRCINSQGMYLQEIWMEIEIWGYKEIWLLLVLWLLRNRPKCNEISINMKYASRKEWTDTFKTESREFEST